MWAIDRRHTWLTLVSLERADQAGVRPRWFQTRRPASHERYPHGLASALRKHASNRRALRSLGPRPLPRSICRTSVHLAAELYSTIALSQASKTPNSRQTLYRAAAGTPFRWTQGVSEDFPCHMAVNIGRAEPRSALNERDKTRRNGLDIRVTDRAPRWLGRTLLELRRQQPPESILPCTSKVLSEPSVPREIERPLRPSGRRHKAFGPLFPLPCRAGPSNRRPQQHGNWSAGPTTCWPDGWTKRPLKNCWIRTA